MGVLGDDVITLRLSLGDVVIFDLRLYIFAQQAALLLKLREPIKVSCLVEAWLANRIIPWMRRHPTAVTDTYINRWVVLTCIDCIQATEVQLGAFQSKPPSASASRKFSLSRANLCKLAVEALKDLDGWTDRGGSSSSVGSGDGGGGAAVSSASKILSASSTLTNPRVSSPQRPNTSHAYSFKWLNAATPSERLAEAMASIDTYDKLYMNLSQCCVDYFMQSNRVRTAARVVYNMGLLYFDRGNYQQAVKYFKRAAKVYGKEGWVRYKNHCLDHICVVLHVGCHHAHFGGWEYSTSAHRQSDLLRCISIRELLRRCLSIVRLN